MCFFGWINWGRKRKKNNYYGGKTNEKNVIFVSVLLLVAIMLFLLRATGLTAHIVISVLGIIVLIAYTVATKKEWKIPALEVVMRACYGIALITGVVIMNVHGIAAIAIVHKVSAALFTGLLLVLFVHKLLAKKSDFI